MTSPLLKKYIDYQKKINDMYPNNSIVLIMVGSFYNAYEFDCNQLKIGHASDISKILNIQLTRNNKKKPHNMSNPIMCGFPVHTISRNISTLINQNYTVALYNQIDNDNNELKDHTLFKIFSPSTHLENETCNNMLMCIIVNEYKCIITSNIIHSLHISYIDLSTGKNYLTELYDISNVQNEINKYITSINPSEIISNIHIETNILCHNINCNKTFNNINYQEHYLNKLFKNDSIISIFQYLDLHNKPDLIYSYIHLLEFAYSHDQTIIYKINKPIIDTNHNILVINNDAQSQLNLFNNKHSLFNIIDKTQTKMGSRELRYRMSRPIIDKEILQERYNNIEKFKDNYSIYMDKLKNVIDIEKGMRKMYMKMLNPDMFANMDNSMNIIIEILKLNNTDHSIIKKFEKFYSYYHTQFDIDIMGMCKDFKVSFFKRGIDKNIDYNNERIGNIKKGLKDIETMLENEKGVQVTLQPDNTFKTTKLAWNSIKNETRKIVFKVGDEDISCELKDFVNVEISKKSYVKLDNKVVKDLIYKLETYEERMSKIVKDKYYDICEYIQNNFSDIIKQVISIICDIDISVCGALMNDKYNYTKPIIQDSDKSFISCKGIRHPIIEVINDNEQYISNDLELDNMLLFGLNSSGKSSLLRSTGINIVLAQMGFYVSCDSFTFYPFTKLISKIGNSDDLFKGQSTFITEMIELKNILNNSDKNTLVLCDELTSGTETNSSVGIVCQTILSLMEKECCFLFTTHLHEILQFEEISKSNELQIKHFKVKLEGGKIGFDRKLKDGSGDNNYGIEIANYLDMDKEFIKGCYKFRNRYEGIGDNILNTKKSRYNSKVFMDSCSMCGKKSDLHTHHIREQNEANKNGMIENFHKNSKFNLLVVCEDCHHSIHSN